jgi:hypothetical protein
MGLWSAPWALTAEKPQYGGILQVAVAGDLPSLDMHQETTFMVVHPMSPMYNTLIQFDPHNAGAQLRPKAGATEERTL